MIERRIKCPDCEWSQFGDELVGMTPCHNCNSTGYIATPCTPLTNEKAREEVEKIIVSYASRVQEIREKYPEGNIQERYDAFSSNREAALTKIFTIFEEQKREEVKEMVRIREEVAYQQGWESAERITKRKVFEKIEECKRITNGYQEDGSIAWHAGDVLITKGYLQALKQELP